MDELLRKYKRNITFKNSNEYRIAHYVNNHLNVNNIEELGKSKKYYNKK